MTCLSPHRRGCHWSPGLTRKLTGFTPYILPPSGNPRKDTRTLDWGSWRFPHITSMELWDLRGQGPCPWSHESSEAPSRQRPPQAAWHLGFPWALTTPLSRLSSPYPPPRRGVVQGTQTYQDKEQKSWGKEAKSHLHSGVGPSSFAPLKFQIPVCGQSPKLSHNIGPQPLTKLQSRQPTGPGLAWPCCFPW